MMLGEGVCICGWRGDVRNVCCCVSRLGSGKAKKEDREFTKWCVFASWFVAGSNLKIV